MPKKWVRGGLTPEGSVYLVEVKVPRLKKAGQLEPPPNFSPKERLRTYPEDNPPTGGIDRSQPKGDRD